MIDVTGASRQDVFGYYEYGPYRTYSKTDLTDFINTSPNRHMARWCFNDRVYSSYDWSIEPSESILELYRRRAQQIRDKYDYLVLWYSGGADSDTILQTFIDNDIKLDEAVSMVNYEGSKDKLSSYNAEIFNVAIPNIEKAKQKQPHLLHRVVDITKPTIERFESLTSEWIFYHSTMFNTSHEVKALLKTKIKEWKNLFNSGKKVGFIHGMDKPFLSIDQGGRCWFQFYDYPINCAVTPYMQMRNEPWDFNELFFWSPECPEIVIKQAHLLKNAVSSVSDWQRYVVVPPDKDKPYKRNEVFVRYETGNSETSGWFDQRNLIDVFYPNWKPIPYQVKAPSIVTIIHDSWFYKGVNEKSFHTWKTGMDQVLKMNRKNYSSFSPVSTTLSKKYLIGKI